MSKPEKAFSQGSCRASIFVNEVRQNGNIARIKKASIQKRYWDRDGNWQNSNSYDVNDLPKLIFVAMKAYDYLTGKEE